MGDIFSLKRELIHLRRQIAPERDAMAVLARRELPIVSAAVGVYFQDLYEHVLRVTDAIDVYRDLLSGVLLTFGYYGALALMATVGIGLAFFFKRKDWL